ncbi:carnitine dehydratase [Mycobacterium sp. CBMA 234]|uniref:CaiB/BaiF CoA transferase family protein n=1 Tax=Mycolicibacterium sp. CBMA 234 TaxID=1918495 RepID=UPI001391374D|nr:CaiB/BaiF CoA-transferase family protein [Mycolicibacterium sp. CBMA 234]MUL65841.1 carnitine dehydratase [Mycolicibacterium sp. CBMA 234]
MSDTDTSRGPLHGLKVIELAGIGPGPYAAMLLADMGADVVRVERPGPPASGVPAEKDVLRRNRRSIVVDLQRPDGVKTVLAMAAKADVLLEGFRPGVTERLGLGPADCWDVNPRLVYGRMTGWGQTGPLAPTAGHDIGYIAITGALGAIGRAGEAPVPPVNLVGDFGGGSTFLVMGVLAAVWEASRSGRGQVVDAAIVDGASSLTGILHGLMAAGQWQDQRGTNFLDTGVPWYDTYQTSDGEWMAVGALEPKFYAEFTRLLGLSEETAALRQNPSGWAELREAITTAFASRTRAEWAAVFEGTDACVAPVLSLTEASRHPHLAERGTFIDVDGLVQPAPAPRFSRTTAQTPTPPPAVGADGADVLRDWAIDDADRLIAEGVVQIPTDADVLAGG